MSQAIKDFYRFGEFTVDGSQKVLLHDGNPVPLAPKVFDTLLILVHNSGRIVGKDELMTRLWPDTFVEESNLTFNIKELRKALGDNARQPRFVETVARRGYRFIAKLQQESAVPFAIEANVVSETPVPAVRKLSFLTIAVIAVFVIGLSIGALWLSRSKTMASAKVAPLLSTPFKSEKFATGGVVRAAITPDGKYVAYTSESGGKESLWLRQLETSENIQIVPPSDQTYLGLVVSHSGNSLYFVRKSLTDPPASALYRVMTFGGIPVKITEQTEGTVSVSPDDNQIAFTRCKYQEEDFCSLMLINADGTNEHKVLTRSRPQRLSGVQFAPNGKSIAFASGESWNGGSNFRLMQLDLATGAEKQLASRTFFDINNLKWLPDGTGLLIAAKESHGGRLRIWLVSAVTAEAQVLTRDATDYISLSLNKTADKMIATHTSNTFQLYLAKIDDVEDARSLGNARTGIAFSREGRIVYAGNDGDIWTINSDGGEQRQLTNNSFSDSYPRLTPDGRYIFFSSNRSGSTRIWRMNSDSTNQVQMTKHEGGYPIFITPDGRWLYFLSGIHGTLWRVSTDGGDETEVSKEQVQNPAFSPDGKYLAYFYRDQKDNRLRIRVMFAETQTLVQTFGLAEGTPYQGSIAWMRDNKTFYYAVRNGSENFLWRRSIDSTSAAQLIGNMGKDEITDLTLTPDDKTVAFIRGRWIHEAVLIEGLK